LKHSSTVKSLSGIRKNGFGIKLSWGSLASQSKESIVVTIMKKASEMEECKDLDCLNHLEQYKEELLEPLKKEISEANALAEKF
jgi:hypothetical protein